MINPVVRKYPGLPSNSCPGPYPDNPAILITVEVFTIMLVYKDTEDKTCKKKSRAVLKFNANLVVIGIVVTMLLMITSAAGAINAPGLNVSNINVTDTQISLVSPVPSAQQLNLVTVLTTQTQNALAALTAQPTVVPTAGPTNLIASTTTKDIVDIGTLNTNTGIVSVNSQFTTRAGKRIPQSQKLAAAADYKATRDAYLLQGNLTAQKTPGGYQTAGYSIAAVPPTMDPGGVPHYFGPFPNYANSPMPMGNISNITVTNGGTGYAAPVVTITDAYFTGSGATATAAVSLGAITNITITNPGINYTAPVVIITDATVGSSGAEATATLGGPFTSGIRKFVDTLPGLYTTGANNLGNFIPVAIPDKTTFPGSDYYEIELGQFTQKMHSDLPNTTFRGYRQTNTVDPNASGFHYLGPLIVATNGTPVRVKFTNSLPVGAGGNLFLPADTTLPGSGMGPFGMNVTPIFYTQNRATLHLHGGTTPWISDGTPDQWITPANESTPYPKGVSVYNVPDMPDPGNGSQTFFYTNQQSARLMFYHDHAAGITRLNVYAGEAAGYLITDPVDTDMITGTNTQGINPTFAKVLPDIGIPLVIQDKTFVDARTIAAQDPTWNWGSTPGVPDTGDLWWPHVYMPAENPGVRSATNPFGRWFYGPWFFPPTPLLHPPIANPYFGQPGEPPQIPGTPNPSAVGEAFMDTPLVNGVAYPNMTVLPQAYRFRILSVADDRFFNLQWYVADANVTTADGRNNTEVRMVAAFPGAPGFPATWPTDGREGGVPDPATRGPSWIQIGTEGGFLPAPVVIPPQPITYVTDPTRFDFGNADKHSLLLAAAERADVIVDFSQYAGKTLILYNDAPAAFPAGISQYDYYTGAPDRTSTGGAPSIIAGYGPNVRTIMQVKVANTTPAAAYNVATLNSVFAKGATKRGVFEVSQPPIIIPQAEYTSAYNQVMPVNNQNNQIQIQDNFYNFTTIFGAQLNITFQPKALHDEMGAVYDEYGRMSGMLGLELPSGTSVTQTFTPYPYASPPTDVIMTSLGALNGSAPGDGTQIWKITHNGVDTHPLHWHMYNVQVISRAPWDGLNNMAPDPNELGWKETIRVSPLEDTYIALRPVNATVPFSVPDNVRAIDPTMPLGVILAGPPGGFFDPAANGITVPNHLVNFGWEYVWHCHILSHEEMDMMHSQAISVNDPGAGPTTLRSGEVHNATTNTTAVFLVWNDQSTQETDWLIQRTNISQSNWTDFMTVPSYSKTQTGGTAMAIDGSIPANTVPNYSYRVLASNVVGDDFVYAAPSVGFPTVMRNSSVSNVNISQNVAPPGAVTFGATPSIGFAPLNVSFTGISARATGWSWNFGDGNWAGDNGMQNPNHVYQLPGNYTVTLTAMTTGGNTSSTQSTTISVTQTPPPAVPVARFTANQTSGNAPLAVAFDATTSTSSPAVWATWRWTFGDGTFSSLQNPTHTYTAGGNYTVSLIAMNLGGTSDSRNRSD